MNRSVIAGSLAAVLSMPLLSQACTAAGYVITVAVPETFPSNHATIYVRHPTSTGVVTAATSTNQAVVSAATSSVNGNQRVLLNASGGGAGTCPGTLVGPIVDISLRP